MNIQDIPDFDPLMINFKNESKSGRQIHYITHRDQIIWSGSVSKIDTQKLKLMWQIICHQQEQINTQAQRIQTLESNPIDIELIPLED
jgi:hypothetical protein